MTGCTDDVARVLAHIRATIGLLPSEWERWPGGWVGDIEAALVDAVFSAQAVYKSKRGKGVHAKITQWRQARDRQIFTLDALTAEMDDAGVVLWARRFGSLQRSPGRPESAPGGAYKAAAVREAASVLVDHGLKDASQICVGNADTVKVALRSVPGIGYATSNYFLMLLGAPGVKPDRMIHRFLRAAQGRDVTNAAAERLIRAGAGRLEVQPYELEHAIWKYESDQSAG
jgi:hypothetical protein